MQRLIGNLSVLLAALAVFGYFGRVRVVTVWDSPESPERRFVRFLLPGQNPTAYRFYGRDCRWSDYRWFGLELIRTYQTLSTRCESAAATTFRPAFPTSRTS